MTFALAFESAYANCNTQSCLDSEVALLYINPVGDVYVKLNDEMSNTNCGVDPITYFKLERTHPAFNEIFSALLSTQMANKRIGQIRIVEGTSDCDIWYITTKP